MLCPENEGSETKPKRKNLKGNKVMAAQKVSSFHIWLMFML